MTENDSPNYYGDCKRCGLPLFVTENHECSERANKCIYCGDSEARTQRLESEINSLEDKLRITKEALDWVRQTVHRAHHDEESLNDCRRNSCIGAKQALAKIEESK